MKYFNSILPFFLLFISLSYFSQIDSMEGLWSSQESNYTTAVFYDNEKFVFKNIGDEPVEETVIKTGKDFIITNLFNPINGYKVQIKYTLLENGDIHSDFSGDWSGVLIWTRL